MVGAAKTGTISSTQMVSLGEAAGSRVSSWLVQLDADGSWNGSVQPVGRAASCQLTVTPNLAYRNMTTGDIATAALTGDSLVMVDSSGMEVSLDFTVVAGSITYHAIPVVG